MDKKDWEPDRIHELIESDILSRPHLRVDWEAFGESLASSPEEIIDDLLEQFGRTFKAANLVSHVLIRMIESWQAGYTACRLKVEEVL